MNMQTFKVTAYLPYCGQETDLHFYVGERLNNINVRPGDYAYGTEYLLPEI